MLSLILPAYNGSKYVRNSLSLIQQRFLEEGVLYEVVVIDDGSEDAHVTKQICEDAGALFYGLTKNQGKGAAVKAGVSRAKGDVIIFTDVDLPFGAEPVLSMYNTLKHEQSAVCIGDRNLPESVYYSEIPKVRKAAGFAFSRFISLFILKGHYDTQCGLKGFKRNAAKSIFSRVSISGFAFDVEVLLIARRLNLHVLTIPVNFVSSQPGLSSALLQNAVNMLVDLITIKGNDLLKKYHKKHAS